MPFFSIQSADQSQFPRIDAMKLQKLLFYSMGWWLAYKDEPLFDQDIFAWPWGPVVPQIYSEFRGFGRNPIEGARAHELVKIGDGLLDFQFRVPDEPNAEVMEFLRSVWDSHKHYTGVQLSNSTHAPGEPLDDCQKSIWRSFKKANYSERFDKRRV